MAKTSREFGNLLRTAVHRIALCQSKAIQAVQDDLGFALDRAGSSAIDFWRRGNVPANADVERLARHILRRSDLGRDWLERFLHHGNYVGARQLCDELFPPVAGAPTNGTHEQPSGFLGHAQGFEAELAPFVAGSPITHPRQFWGRERELRSLFGSLGRIPMRNTAIIGPQRSGKTSLLHYLGQITTARPEQLRPDQRGDWLRQPERYRWVFVDFQDVRMTTQERLLGYILRALGLPVPAPCSLDRFLDVMADGLRDPAVLLLDEVGAALEREAFDQSFWWSMRSLVTNLAQGRLACIVTSQRSPDKQAEDLGKPSPFFNIFYRLDLGPFAEAEARSLVLSSPQHFAPDDIDWIIAASGRWPSLVQILCNVRLSALENGEGDATWKDEGLQQIARYRSLLTAP